jgi:hypothetical protein
MSRIREATVLLLLALAGCAGPKHAPLAEVPTAPPVTIALPPLAMGTDRATRDDLDARAACKLYLSSSEASAVTKALSQRTSGTFDDSRVQARITYHGRVIYLDADGGLSVWGEATSRMTESANAEVEALLHAESCRWCVLTDKQRATMACPGGSPRTEIRNVQLASGFDLVVAKSDHGLFKGLVSVRICGADRTGRRPPPDYDLRLGDDAEQPASMYVLAPGWQHTYVNGTASTISLDLDANLAPKLRVKALMSTDTARSYTLDLASEVAARTDVPAPALDCSELLPWLGDERPEKPR